MVLPERARGPRAICSSREIVSPYPPAPSTTSMPTSNAYDDLSYESLAYPQSHPDRLATVATLFGLKPARIDDCRVLEIGCAAGGNLLPMAAGLPTSEFVGVDLSAPQIAEAQRAAEALKLGNLELHAI